MSIYTGAVIDACLFINWSKFSLKEDLRKLASRLFMPEVVFQEIKSPHARALAAEWLSSRFLVLTPLTKLDETEVENVLSIMSSYPQIPPLDPPELYAFVLARRLRIPLLTDNKAPKRLVEVAPSYSGVIVLDSLDILVKLYGSHELKAVVERFMADTSFRFSSRRLAELGLR